MNQTHLLLCCSNKQCSGQNRSPSHDASPQQRARRGSAWAAWSLESLGCWRRSRAQVCLKVPGSSRAPYWEAGRSWRGLRSSLCDAARTTWGPIPSRVSSGQHKREMIQAGLSIGWPLFYWQPGRLWSNVFLPEAFEVEPEDLRQFVDHELFLCFCEDDWFGGGPSSGSCTTGEFTLRYPIQKVDTDKVFFFYGEKPYCWFRRRLHWFLTTEYILSPLHRSQA